jgi:Ca-activated chloride channel family protein
MQKKMIAAPALAGLVALPIAGYATFELMKTSPVLFAPRGRRSMLASLKPSSRPPISGLTLKRLQKRSTRRMSPPRRLNRLCR